MTVVDIQRALSARGFDPGPLDGAWGRRSIAAMRAFQSALGLRPDGVAGPITLAELGAGSRAMILPPWYEEARRRMGLSEVRDRTALAAWLRSDGSTVGDPTALPWCGDFVETCLALTLPDEPLPANPYLARSWLSFGRTLTDPAPGAVAVFWRGSKAGRDGHVAFYTGERDDAVRVLGGNQANAVTEAWIAKDRLLGFRWPATVEAPAAGRRRLSAAGKLSTNEA